MPNTITLTQQIKHFYTEIQDAADPALGLGRGQRMKRKIAKSIWAAQDHKKTKIGLWAGIVGANIGVAIGTGGLSIPAQIGIGAGMGATGGGINKGINWAIYKANKRKLGRVMNQTGKVKDNLDPEQIKRMDVRRLAENYIYNEVHLKSAMARSVLAHGEVHNLISKLKLMKTGYTEETELLADFAKIFLLFQELDVMLHYLNEMQALKIVARAFLEHVNSDVDKAVAKLNTDVEVALKGSNDDHKKRCGDNFGYCYGPSKSQGQVRRPIFDKTAK